MRRDIVHKHDIAGVQAWSQHVLGENQIGVTIRLNESGLFDTQKLIPGFFREQGQPSHTIILPLFSQNESYGYAVSEVGTRDGAVYETLIGSIGSSLKGIRLLEREKNAASELEKLVQTRTEELHSALDELKKHNKTLKYHAERDGLTGLYNHKTILDLLNARIEEAERHCSPISVIMMDLDNFKEINDQYGHQAGDEVLIRIAGVLQNSIDIERKPDSRPGIRKYDSAGRYGGDEFFLILPHCGSPQIESVSARILERTRAIHFQDYPDMKISASIGVAVIPELKSDVDPGHLVRKADEALYFSKKNGKNRITVLTCS